MKVGVQQRQLEDCTARGEELRLVIRVEEGQLEAGRRLVEYIYTGRRPPVATTEEIMQALDMLNLAEQYEFQCVRKRCTRALASVQPEVPIPKELEAKVQLLAAKLPGNRGIQNLLKLIQELEIHVQSRTRNTHAIQDSGLLG